jgi:hypothetical protein
VYSLNVATYRKPGNEPDTSAMSGIFDYEQKKSEKFEQKVDQMNSHIKNLEQSIDQLQAKVKAYNDIILKYESIFREEILLYRLQKTKLTTMQDAFHNQQLFTKEIEQHVTSYINETLKLKKKNSTFKRIILRFIHQNKRNQCNTNNKISEIEDLINKKHQLLERFQTEVKNWNKKLSMSIAPKKRPQITLN